MWPLILIMKAILRFKPGEKMEFEEAFEEYKLALFAGGGDPCYRIR